MEISQPEPSHGDKSDQLDTPRAVNPPLPPLTDAASNTNQLPTFKVDDSAAQEETLSEKATSTDAEMTDNSLAPPDSEVNSVIQPGRQVSDSQLPTELSGALTKIQELLGSVKKNDTKIDDGTYADVFKGTLDMPDGSRLEVAIKCIRRIDSATDERFNTRVRREAYIWMTANHPNILEFIGYQMVDGKPWLVSPFCKHRSLTHYIKKDPNMLQSEKLRLLCGAARGLAHLHALTPIIVHGDIKPDNVLVKDNLEAALCDFGVSRIFVGTGKTSGLTTTGNRVGGTAGYQAKEVLISAAPSTEGDVYAFGGLILAAMSGNNPFWRKKNEAVRIAAVCMDEIPIPKDHPRLPAADSLWGLLRECWNIDPEKRPNMETILQRLESEREKRLEQEEQKRLEQEQKRLERENRS
ncbi:hypothetical protein FRC01_006222 [Tulasnella sp. 417]|nr:hypothetical protein FRC01_006222 [Tulasnella sp. 417]